jgi:Ca2+-binding EF-hand superfamily protein
LICLTILFNSRRLQSAAAGNIAVGHQHGYTGVWNALATIVRTDGATGLYRGSMLSIFRSIVGSGSNLAAFTLLKEHLMTQHRWQDNAWLDVTCGLGSSIISVYILIVLFTRSNSRRLSMNPIDVTRTRYYNQPYVNGQGTVYSSGLDAVTKMLRNEGPSAFYKGLTTHFLRIGPHFCFTFLFLGIFRRRLTEVYEYLDHKDSFAAYDKDHDGKLNKTEISSMLKDMSLDADSTASLIERSDADHDGCISWSEYPPFVKEVEKLYSSRASNLIK